jgi:hypothetical protein
MHTSVVLVSSVIFVLRRRLKMLNFFLRRQRRMCFLDDFFQMILFPRIFQMEIEKRTDRQRTDKN